jgi:conjugal transfer pilus assembly protein TraL
MQPTDLSHYIPQRLDAPGKFLFWEYDVALIALAGVLLGLAIEKQLIGLIIGVIAAFFYNKLKAGRHPGMASHLLYWYMGTPTPKSLPPSNIRELIG